MGGYDHEDMRRDLDELMAAFTKKYAGVELELSDVEVNKIIVIVGEYLGAFEDNTRAASEAVECLQDLFALLDGEVDNKLRLFMRHKIKKVLPAPQQPAKCPDDPCIVCGINDQAEGSKYCKECVAANEQVTGQQPKVVGANTKICDGCGRMPRDCTCATGKGE